jgi:hypothetical protein
LTSGTVVAPSRPNSSRVGSFTNSVRVPAANATVSCRSTSGSRDTSTPSSAQAAAGRQLIGVNLPFLKTLGGRRRYQEAKIRELANERREQPSACAAWFLPPHAAAAHVRCHRRHVFASTDDSRRDRRKQHRIHQATPSRGLVIRAAHPISIWCSHLLSLACSVNDAVNVLRCATCAY